VLPEDSPSAAQRMLTLAAAQARAGQPEAAAQLLDDLIWRLQEDFEASGPGESAGSNGGRGARAAGPPPAPCLVPACVYAQLLDLCEDPFADAAGSAAAPEDDARSSGGAGPGGGLTDLRRLVAFQIRAKTKDAPKDSLTAPAASLALLLGEGHPVARAMAEAAEANMSLAARQARELRQQQATLAASMEVLKVRRRGGVRGRGPACGKPAACDWRGTLSAACDRHGQRVRRKSKQLALIGMPFSSTRVRGIPEASLPGPRPGTLRPRSNKAPSSRPRAVSTPAARAPAARLSRKRPGPHATSRAASSAAVGRAARKKACGC
jgi:hypothetical protein